MMNHKLLKQRYTTILGFFLSIIFMYLTFRKVDTRALGISLKTADLTYMLLALLPLSASYITKTFLWRKIVSTFKNVGFSNTFSALMIGFLGNNILPGRAGEFMRAYILGSKENIGKTFILGTIVIERLFDIFTLLLFVVLSTFMFRMPEWAKRIAVTTSIVLLIVLAIAYLILLKQNPLLEKFENKLFFLTNPKTRFVITRLVVRQLEDDGISAVLWFDKLTTNGLTQIPFTLSLSKGVFACPNPIKFRLTDH